MAFLFDKMHKAAHDVGYSIKKHLADGGDDHAHTSHTHHQQHASACSDGDSHHLHRYQSFAPQREGNDVKWYVDGCNYMWAVSMALENARESIWILDWWLSPELYLRRPPAKHEEYRLDRLLQRAADRGVKVNIIVYKEVTQALTHPFTKGLTRLGLDVTFRSLEYWEEEKPLIPPPISVSSSHTKHWLEDNDKTGNICVFRHPDHVPDKKALASGIWQSITSTGLSAAKASKLPGEALKGIYGMNDDTVLYWAHHEKLCLVDGQIAFMGGLDLCYGRWDTNQHSIADAHPGDLNDIIFPGQDYNNARIMDFADVQHWQNNKLDRKYNSRMGWTDVSICLQGPVVQDLKAHFAERWNFIYNEKYYSREDSRYQLLEYRPSRVGIIGHPYRQAEGGAEVEGHGQYQGFREQMRERYHAGRERLEDMQDRFRGETGPTGPLGGLPCQILRSCAKWSHGVALEHSICNAYIQTISESKYFVYIENQFFITATGPGKVKNRIGAAIVERIIRAARNREPYHIIVMMPAVPAFAGDLQADEAIATRAIMEFQYDSINRGGRSIMEQIAREGIDPMQYIRFYNLRSYDRINSSDTMQQAEQQSGVSYDDARRGHDQRFGHGTESQQYGQEYSGTEQNNRDAYNAYQHAAHSIQNQQSSQLSQGHWDSVASCYMLGGEDIRNVPWASGSTDEIDAFVSEELYIHSKLLIADDRVVIIGSANLNDRSQLGYHDSEIAIRIDNDPQIISSTMATHPWPAGKFASALRRQIFRKHLGLLRPQDPQTPDANFSPIGIDPNAYDWGSTEDAAVADPLSPSFERLWKGTARTNTQAFAKVFHPVPSDDVRNWKEYDDYYSKHFGTPSTPTKPKPKSKSKSNPDTEDTPTPTPTPDSHTQPTSTPTSAPPLSSQTTQGHVVLSNFSPGEQGAREVKEVLSGIRGTLVEMPLLFLRDEDIAQEGLSLNAFTEEVYT